jgi:hypothetical protein
MLRTVVDAGEPALLISAIAVVGMELTAEDFRRIATQRGTVVATTVGQVV